MPTDFVACYWIYLEGSKPTLTINKHGILFVIFLEDKVYIFIYIPERLSMFNVFMTKCEKELINLSERHEDTKITYWKAVKFAYFGIDI